MHEQTTAELHYMVRLHGIDGAPDTFRFTFAPRGLQHVHRPGEPPKPVPMYVATVQSRGEALIFNWSRPPDRTARREDLERIAKDRLTERHAWIDRVSNLVEQIEKWAGELGWAARRLDKKIEDPRLGDHRVNSLLMQDGTIRVLLEPISASAPDSDGLVDLYLMPGYDDIANLYYREGLWHVHYVFPNTKAVAAVKAGESRPLSKRTLGVVLGEMKKNGE